jgi:uncharacterized protein (TIGR03086 family)
MSALDLYGRAGQSISRLLDNLKAKQLNAPTPNSQWSVRDLLNHITSEQLWVPELMAGKTVAEVGDKYDGDVIGDDPRAVWGKTFSAAQAAFAKPGALDDSVHLSFGDTPAKHYLEQMFIDLVIHGWDLARGLKAADQIDPELVQACYDILQPQAEDWRSGGAFGPAVQVPEDADLQTKLLALSGRQP